MEFDLSETQKLFKDSARELFAQECPPTLVREMIDKNVSHSDRLWDKLVEQGWTGLMFPEELGGLGLGLVDMAVAFEEMGRALIPGAFFSTVALAGSLVEKTPASAQREKYLRAVCDGRVKATVALAEESGNWDPASVRLQANESTNGIKLTGKKLFVTDALFSDLIIVVAKSAAGLILAAIDKTAPGVSVAPMQSMDVTRQLGEIRFNDAFIPESDILAKGDAARAAIGYATDVAALALSAEMVGGMQRVLEMTVEYAKTRKQFGKPIGQFQAVQHHCANMLLMTESSRSAVYYAAWVMGADPEQAPLAVSIAKAYASDSFREVGNLGIQVHGGVGFTWDEDIQFFYKRAKASELMLGDATYHRERIARLVVDRATEPSKAVAGSGD